MNTTTHGLRFEHHGPDLPEELVSALGVLYAAAYADTPQGTDPFYSPARFAERLTGYARSPGFALFTARAGDDLVGYAFGYLLPRSTRWWSALVELTTDTLTTNDLTTDDLTTETGTRTFALCELHVRVDHRSRGVASLLHSELLAAHPHIERATVLARPDNPALATYRHWGYRPIGRLKPYPDSPTYTALILPLPPTGRGHRTCGGAAQAPGSGTDPPQP